MKKFSNEYLSFNVNPDQKYENINIDGIIFNPSKYNSMIILGANPPDILGNYSGTSLPFPSYDIAFENTINKYIIDQHGSFNINFKYPNSYYNKLGSEYVKPHLKLLFNDENGNMYGKIVTILLGNGIPYRSLGNKNTKYIKNRVNDNIPFQTQFKILETSYYPNRM